MTFLKNKHEIMGYNWAGGGCGAGEEQYKSFTREPKQQIPMIYIGVNMMT